jgi:hypothetical protein
MSAGFPSQRMDRMSLIEMDIAGTEAPGEVAG